MKIKQILNWFKSEKVTTFLKSLAPSVKWVVILALGIAIGNAIYHPTNTPSTFNDLSSGPEETSNTDCNVIAINIHGFLQTYISDHADGDTYFNYDTTSSDDVDWLIKKANKESNIKAVVIEVDSTGGSPVAGSEIDYAVRNSEKTVIAFIRGSGASAAYMAISGADKIFASKSSDVGSIGATMSYISNVEKNKKDGYTYVQLSSGKYKDAGDPDKVLTQEEKNLFQRDIDIIFNNFVKDVASNRHLSIEKVKGFADGSTVLGEQAKKLGLIDEIGGLPEVEKYLEKELGEKPEMCW